MYVHSHLLSGLISSARYQFNVPHCKRPPIERILFGTESPAFRPVAPDDLEGKTELYCVLARKTRLRRESEENESETCGLVRSRRVRRERNKAWNSVHSVEKKTIKDLPSCRITRCSVHEADSSLATGFFFYSSLPSLSLFYRSPYSFFSINLPYQNLIFFKITALIIQWNNIIVYNKITI